MVATSNVQYDWFQTNVYFTTKNGDDTETHYPVGWAMDRFFSPQTPGLVLLHGAGNIFMRHLAPGEGILIKPTTLLYKDPSVQMHLHMEVPGGYAGGGFFGGWSNWNHRHMWLRLIGPGRVCIQSAFKHMEDNGRNMTRNSYMTQASW
jgi:uncharacterized protein (AIM24 family)